MLTKFRPCRRREAAECDWARTQHKLSYPEQVEQSSDTPAPAGEEHPPHETGAGPAGRLHGRVDRLRDSGGEILRPATPHEFGRPDVTEHAFANRTYLVANVEPLDVNGVRTIGFGALLWLVAFVALLPFRSTLQDSGRLWWLWTCLAGAGLGLVGWEYCRRRRAALRSGEPTEAEAVTDTRG